MQNAKMQMQTHHFRLWPSGWGLSIAINTFVSRMVAQSTTYIVVFSSLAFRPGDLHVCS